MKRRVMKLDPSKRIRGIMAAVLTPFDNDDRVDYAALEREVEYTIETCKAHAIIAAGVESQEYQALRFDERKELLRRTIEFVRGRVPVVAGVSHASIHRLEELIRFAEDCGADAVQVIATPKPWGTVPSRDELLSYFEHIDRLTQLPLLIYNNPRLGVDLDSDVMIELSQLDNVSYFKETSRDMAKISRLIAEIDVAGHAGYFTTIEVLLPSLQLGGSGAMMPPPAVKLAVRIYDAYMEGRHEEAIELQRYFSLYPARWMQKGLLPAMKASMKAIGQDVGDPLAPYEPLSERQVAEIRKYLQSTGVYD